MRPEEFFYCYDKNLSNQLRKMGNRYIMSARPVNKDKIYTLFYRDKKLNESLKKIGQ